MTGRRRLLLVVLLTSLLSVVSVSAQQDIPTIQYGDTVSGQLASTDDIVLYTFDGTAGDPLVIEVTSDVMDPYVVLADSQGNLLAENDDIAADNLNSHLEFTLPANATYLIAVLGYSPGAFTLTLSIANAAPEPAAVQDITGSLVTGEITNAVPVLTFPITDVPQGARITLDARATSGDLDTYLLLFYGDTVSTETLVLENDDREPNNLNSFIEYADAQAGNYIVAVTRYGVDQGQTSGMFALGIDVSNPPAAIFTEPVTSPPDPIASGFPSLTPTQQASWTVLAYMGGDNNLEAGLINDINEFELAGGSTEQVRIVVLMDRSDEFDASNGDWVDVRLFEIGPDSSADEQINYPPTLDSIPLAGLGELNTSYRNNLTDFLVWGVTSYPADHYAVVINDHGGAWSGMVTDDTTGPGNILTIPEIRQAFATALETAGIARFDLLINDACLMSSVEYLAAMSPYFNYAFGSPEIMLNPGYDMALFTSTLRRTPEIPLSELGALMVDKYMEDMAFGSPDLVRLLTANVIGFERYDPVVQSLDDFASLVNGFPQGYAPLLGQARASTFTYSTELSPDTPTTVDLGNFMQQVIRLSTDPQLTSAAQNVLNALDGARLYARGGDDVASLISYYNIYFPARAADFNSEYLEQSPLEGWSQMLRNYYSNVERTNAPVGEEGVVESVPPQVSITNVFPAQTSIHFPTVIGMEVVGRNIFQADFTVDQVQPDGTAVRLETSRILTEVVNGDVVQYVNQWRPGVDDFRFHWGVTLPVVSDGTTTHNELVVFSEDGLGSLKGRYRFPGDNAWQEVTIIFDNEGNTERLMSSDASGLAVGNITPAAGGEFQAYRALVTVDGRVKLDLGTLYTWPAEGLRWEDAPAPTGQYRLGFLAQSFSGDLGFGATTATVNNDNLDAGLRGYSDLDWGIHFLRPADWTDASYYPENGWLQSGNVDATENIFVYPVETESPDLQAIANDMFGRYQVTPGGTFTPITVAGMDALEFTFTYNTESGISFNGRAFAVYLENLQLGLVFAAETAAGLDNDRVYQLLLNYVSFFDVQAVNAQDAGEWELTSVSDATQYPVRMTWLPGEDTDFWRLYRPNGNTSSPLFLGVGQQPGTDVNTVLNQLVNQYAASQPGFEVRYEGPWANASNPWQSVIYAYSTTTGDTTIGVLAVKVENDVAYALWFESPEATVREEIFGTFEPTLYGFIISE